MIWTSLRLISILLGRLLETKVGINLVVTRANKVLPGKEEKALLTIQIIY